MKIQNANNIKHETETEN